MSEGEHAASGAPPPWLADLGEAAVAVRELAQAQWQLLGAELRLARSAARTLLVAMVLALVFAVALGLSLLALVGIALWLWLGSWIWALLVLAGLLALGLVASIMVGKRCLHWLSLPGTRAQLHAFARPPAAKASAAGTPETNRETSADDPASETV